MWKRGKRSRSNSSTVTPCCASSVETVDPAGPPPMTTTSVMSTLEQMQPRNHEDTKKTIHVFFVVSCLRGCIEFSEPPASDLRSLPGSRSARIVGVLRTQAIVRCPFAIGWSSFCTIARVADRLLRHLRDAQIGPRTRPRSAARRWNSNDAATRGQPISAVRRMDAQPGLAPQRVLRLLHVAEEPAESARCRRRRFRRTARGGAVNARRHRDALRITDTETMSCFRVFVVALLYV